MPRIVAIAGALLLLAGCAAPTPAPSPAPAPRPAAPAVVELDNAADDAKVTLRRGDELKVILDANATTGFQWQTPTSVGPMLSPIGERVYVFKSADPRAVGAGGINIFRFRAEQAGALTVQFDYRRSWETVPPVKTVRYAVTVE